MNVSVNKNFKSAQLAHSVTASTTDCEFQQYPESIVEIKKSSRRKVLSKQQISRSQWRQFSVERRYSHTPVAPHVWHADLTLIYN